MRPAAPLACCLVLSLVLSLGASIGLATAGPLAAQECRSGPVALDTRATLLLPSSFGISGVAAGTAGSLALWSAGGEVFSVDREHSLTRVQLPDSIRPAGMAITADGLRLLDQATGREYLVGSGGRIVLAGRVRLGMAEQLDQALWQGGGWVLGLRDLASRRFVVRRFSPTAQAELFRSSASDSVKTIQRYHLTDSGRGLLLTRSMAPFTVIRLDPSSGLADTLAAPLGPATDLRIPMDSLPHWRALPVVALECTVLLTLSDLTADRRVLVRYGADDQVARVTELDAPLGLVTRLPGDDGVLAARRAGELELVWYDWHWVREPSLPTP
jgi:hypothetical protein